MVGTEVPRLSFGQEHFGEASLGDERRTRSLVDLADRFHRHPHGSLPAKCKDANVLRRCYDLMNVPAVTHEAVLAAPVQRTLRLMRRQTGPVLIVHDGSELDYSGLTSLHEQLGQIGNGFGKGYECLNSLAVLPQSRTVLGLVGQLLHVRPRVPKEETRAEIRDRQDRESLLWLKAVDAVAEADEVCRRRWDAADASEGPTTIDVVDRGGDTFEFMDHEEVLGRRCLLRSKHNRRIRIGHEEAGPQGKLHDYLRTLPERGRRPLSLPERAGRPARQTTIAVAWAAVELTPSKEHRAGGRRQPLRMWALRVGEPTPPTKGEGVEWLLLTNTAVTAAETAWEKVDWYCCRWQIEIFFRFLKHILGCRRLLSTHPAGVEIQAYCVLIACLLIAL